MIREMKVYTRLFIIIAILAVLSFVLHQAVTAAPTAPPAHAPSWSAPQLVSLESQSAVEPKVAADPVAGSQEVLIAFNQRFGSGGNNDPYFVRSTDNGQTWSFPAPIHNSPSQASNSTEVTVAYDNSGKAHAVWVEAEALAYAPETSWPTDNTTNQPFLISQPGSAPGAAAPLLVATEGNILDVIWSEGSNGESPNIYHARSTNGGASWPIKGVIRDTPAESRVPSLAVSPSNSNRLYAVWEEQVPGSVLTSTYAIHFSQGTVNGATVSWTTPIIISPGEGEIENVSYEQPEIIATSQGLHVTFSYHDRDNELQLVYYLRCSSMNCAQAGSWSGPTNVGGQFVKVNGTLPFYVVSSMVRYGPCVQVYYHGVEPDLAEGNEQIWGVNNCDSWSGGGIDEVTPFDERSVNPNMTLTPNGWIYLVYSKVVSSELLQIYFVSSYDETAATFEGVFLPIIFRN